MGQVRPLHPESDPESQFQGPPAEVRSIDSGRCALCGAQLGARSLRYHLVSPLCCDAPITVCHTCRRAALGEGYRPAE